MEYYNADKIEQNFDMWISAAGNAYLDSNYS